MERWTKERANEWYAKRGRIIGFNYVPSTAANSTEMWQNATYDRETIARELSLAANAGYNSCRVFLQFIVWEAERGIFIKNFGDFCRMAASNGISVMPVLFDDIRFSGSEPYLGEQKIIRGVHNSGWTPSPGPAIADDPGKEALLREYIINVVGEFKDRPEIIAWDLYNEPGETARKEKSLPLVKKTFRWAREAGPSQPLTTGIYAFEPYEYRFAELSDIVSYHDYEPLAKSEEKIARLRKYGRPLLCTEWLNRPSGNTFANHLPLFKRENIGIYQWGLVAGKTQTYLSWKTIADGPDSFQDVWQHDVFYEDGTPYDGAEMEMVRETNN